jgi:aminoglycoside phosphotransferase (APT) family kinase protein
VRRVATDRTPWIHRLLVHLHDRGFEAAPRPLGIDERGREVLSWIDGDTHHGAEPDVEVLAEAMRLVRRLHDLTADTELAGGEECVIHGDLSPRNTIHLAGHAVAFIDWDTARPGSRWWDVSRACWQFVDPRPGSDPAEVARRWRSMLDAYGMEDGTPLVAEVLLRLDENADDIEAKAAAGSEAYQRLVDLAAPTVIRSIRDWVIADRDELERGVGGVAN